MVHEIDLDLSGAWVFWKLCFPCYNHRLIVVTRARVCNSRSGVRTVLSSEARAPPRLGSFAARVQLVSNKFAS